MFMLIYIPQGAWFFLGQLLSNNSLRQLQTNMTACDLFLRGSPGSPVPCSLSDALVYTWSRVISGKCKRNKLVVSWVTTITLPLSPFLSCKIFNHPTSIASTNMPENCGPFHIMLIIIPTERRVQQCTRCKLTLTQFALAHLSVSKDRGGISAPHMYLGFGLGKGSKSLWQ